MSGQRGSGDFSVQCACGIVFNTNDDHLGKRLQCKCGRTVSIVRPVKVTDDAVHTVKRAKRRRRDAHPRNEGGRYARALAVARVTRRVAATSDAIRGSTVSALHRVLSDMTSRRRARRWTTWLCWGYWASCVVAWLLLMTLSDSFLPVAFLAYGPRFVLLLPLAILLPAALIAARRALLPLVLALLMVVGPIMGGRVSWRTVGRGVPLHPAENVTRVLTYNVEGGATVAKQLRTTINRLQPQVISLQECGDEMWDSLRAIPKFHTHRHANLCTASRWPITSFDSMPRQAFTAVSKLGFGGTALVARYVISTDHGPLVLVTLHLETARKGLEQFMGSDGFIADRGTSAGPPQDVSLSRFELNARIRDQESERASVWSTRGDQQPPVIIVGDFNMPAESAIYRKHWGRFRDAFDESGSGFGWSRREGALLRIRIDHILGNSTAPRAVGAWLGPNLGSDHLPVIADLRWPANRSEPPEPR